MWPATPFGRRGLRFCPLPTVLVHTVQRSTSARDPIASNLLLRHLPSPFSSRIARHVLDPVACRTLVPALEGQRSIWVYRYADTATGWTLSIATHAEPGSRKLSLGGFRIAPLERTSAPGYDGDREAIGLAMGMEEKIHWSRLLRVGGPLALRDADRLVGGKCVLTPTADARVGQTRDAEVLDFAVECFRDFEKTAGVLLITGQDLGHGRMSNGRSQSLGYVNARFPGSVLSDTSKPTAEGNYYVLRGMLRALRIEMPSARVGLIGCGNIGERVLQRLRADGASCLVLEANDRKRLSIGDSGIPTWSPAGKDAFLVQPMDALVVNAGGGTLDRATIARVIANPRLRAICGCENLAMPEPDGAEDLRRARRAWCPTELGGMMGYLTAVEEYLSQVDGVPFRMTTMFEAAKRLETAGFEATERAIRSDFDLSFEDAVRRTCCSSPAGV